MSPIHRTRRHPSPPRRTLLPAHHVFRRWPLSTTSTANNPTSALKTLAQTQTSDEMGEIRACEGDSEDEEGQEGVGRGEAGVGQQVGMEGQEQGGGDSVGYTGCCERRYVHIP